MKVTLKDMLPQAADSAYAIAGFNVFSIDWARAIIRAAEFCNAPVILMTNKSMIANMPPEYCGHILSDLAEKSSVPVGVHLDHNTDFDVISSAIENGFSSVMFDGSSMILDENIEVTKKIAELAHKKGLSVEGEVGTVRYTDVPETNTVYTTPEEAQRFVEGTGVDALAVSVGTTHRMITQGAQIQYERIAAIEKVVRTPLVIHGTSGVSDIDLRMMKKHRIAKFNIGTVLRQEFATQLRHTLLDDEHIFDLFEISKAPYHAVEKKAIELIQLLQQEAE